MDAVLHRLRVREMKIMTELELVGPRAGLSPGELRERERLAAKLHAVRSAIYMRQQMGFKYERP